MLKICLYAVIISLDVIGKKYVQVPLSMVKSLIIRDAKRADFKSDFLSTCEVWKVNFLCVESHSNYLLLKFCICMYIILVKKKINLSKMVFPRISKISSPSKKQENLDHFSEVKKCTPRTMFHLNFGPINVHGGYLNIKLGGSNQFSWEIYFCIFHESRARHLWKLKPQNFCCLCAMQTNRVSTCPTWNYLATNRSVSACKSALMASHQKSKCYVSTDTWARQLCKADSRSNHFFEHPGYLPATLEQIPEIAISLCELVPDSLTAKIETQILACFAKICKITNHTVCSKIYILNGVFIYFVYIVRHCSLSFADHLHFSLLL